MNYHFSMDTADSLADQLEAIFGSQDEVFYDDEDGYDPYPADVSYDVETGWGNFEAEFPF